jgi:hypothetical protein
MGNNGFFVEVLHCVCARACEPCGLHRRDESGLFLMDVYGPSGNIGSLVND